MSFRTLLQRLITAVSPGVVLLTIMLSPVWANPAGGGGGADYETGKVIVKLDPAAGATISAINATYGTTSVAVLPHSGGIYLLQLPPGTTVDEIVQVMENDRRLAYAEPNFIAEAPEANPRDTHAWGGHNPVPFFGQYAVAALNLTGAHDISRGGGTVVAVLDTGVQLDHLALTTSLAVTRYDFVDDDPVPEDEPNGLDDDGDSLVDEAAGHGTHVAGIIHLVAPEAQIMPLRVLDSDGRGNMFTLAEALLYAGHNGAGVINLSLGTPARSKLLRDTIRELTHSGVVVVAAAGNLNADVEQYPAADQCALAVTSVGPTGTKSTFANFGNWVAVAAPGEAIYSTFPIHGYAWWSGTSMATPFAAGQVALIRSMASSLTVREVAELIGGTAQPLDALNPAFAGRLGAGRLDIGASLVHLMAGVWPDAGRGILSNSCSE